LLGPVPLPVEVFEAVVLTAVVLAAVVLVEVLVVCSVFTAVVSVAAGVEYVWV
jgi:hypothetical protein